MNTRAKFILTYLGGVITGIVLVLAFGFFVAMAQVSNNNNNDTESNKDVQMFDAPKQVIDASSFRVMQVLPDGSALARYEDLHSDEGTLEYGTVVMFLASDNESFYDDQVISLPKGKCFRQIGTYRYMTRRETEKTVPVLGIYDK